MTEFSSLFGERINAYLADRVTRGFNRETCTRHFIKFDQWVMANHSAEINLTRELIHEWIDSEAASHSEMAQRVTAIRHFGRYLCALGEDAYVLPEKYAPLRSRAVPYLFTDSELTALFISIDALPGTRTEPFLNETAPVLFRLIYTCGLRPNEGRELLRENVNLDNIDV